MFQKFQLTVAAVPLVRPTHIVVHDAAHFQLTSSVNHFIIH